MHDSPPAVPSPRRTSALATASLVFGCLVIVPFLGILTGLVAAVLGIIALIKINNSDGRLHGTGLAIAGLILGTVGGVFIQGVMAAMAIPAFQKVRAVSQEKAVTNNLRQFASASQQYMLNEGVARVTAVDIIGPEKPIDSLEPVAGESYEDLVVTQEMSEISVTLRDGRAIVYTF